MPQSLCLVIALVLFQVGAWATVPPEPKDVSAPPPTATDEDGAEGDGAEGGVCEYFYASPNENGSTTKTTGYSTFPGFFCRCPGDPPGHGVAIIPGLNGNPIRLFDGSVVEVNNDVLLPGSGKISFVHTRSYNSSVVGAVGQHGNVWSGMEEYSLSQDGSDTVLYISANSRRVFKTSALTPPFGSVMRLVHKSGDKEYHLTEFGGDRLWIFHDFTVSNTYERGLLKEQTNRQLYQDEDNGLTYTYNSSGLVSQVTTSGGQDYTVIYDYNASDFITHIKVFSETPNINEDNNILEIEYTYGSDVTGLSNDVGTSDDLVQVRRARREGTGSVWTERYTQYRYHEAGLLKAVYESDAIVQLVSEFSSVSVPEDILEEDDDATSSGSQIDDFASRGFEYYGENEGDTSSIVTALGTENLHSKYVNQGAANIDVEGWVKSESVRSPLSGSGCCGGSGSGGTIRTDFYYIEANSSSTAESENEVRTITVFDTIDSDDNFVTRTISGLSHLGTDLRLATIEDPAGSAKYWCTSRIFDADGRVSEVRSPSAHDVTSDSELKTFLDPYDPFEIVFPWGNDHATVETDSGEIVVSTYNTDGLRDSAQVKQGRLGTTYYTWAAEYGSGATGSPVDRVINEWSYPDQVVANATHSNRSQGVLTTYAYTFHDTSNIQIKKKTTTFVAVPTSNNGSGQTTTTEEYYDELGRLRWSKDGEGYITYTSYHPENGSMAYTVQDADPGSLPSDADNNTTKWLANDTGTNKPSRDTGLPTALEMVSTNEFDDRGRSILSTSPYSGSGGGDKTYTVYEENRTIVFPHWNGTTTLVPIQVTERDDAGRTTETYSLLPSRATASGGLPTGIQSSTPSSHYVTWSKTTYDPISGQVLYVDTYYDIAGDDFNRTASTYDSVGRQEATIQMVSGTLASATVQVIETVYDVLGRSVEMKRAADTTMSLNVSKVSDLTLPTTTLVGRTIYDDGGVGDGLVTLQVQYYDTGATDNTGGKTYYTYRGVPRGSVRIYGYNHSNGTSTAQAPYSVADVQWAGQTEATALYSSEPTWSNFADGYTAYADSTATNRIQLATTSYDDLGRAYRSERFEINGSGGKGDNTESNTYYDRKGRSIASQTIGGAQTETAYDGVGRAYQTRTVVDSTAPSYTSGVFNYHAPEPDPLLAVMTGGADEVLTISHSEFDDDGNSIAQHTLEVEHSDVDTGISMSTNNYVRRSVYSWYDDVGRATAMADYGSGGSTWGYNAIPSRPGTAPSTSSSVLVSTMTYDADTGRPVDSVDPAGVTTRTFYDDLGRTTYVAESWDNFTPSNLSTTGSTNKDEDRVVKREYDGAGNVTKLTAMDQNGDGNASDDEVTEYAFGDDYNASLATLTIYPDGSSSGGDNVTQDYFLDGSVKTKTDQRGTVITYAYEIIAGQRRQTMQKVTTVGSDTDSTVRSIKQTFDSPYGRLTNIQSFASSDGTGTPLNEVEYLYENDFHNKASESRQSHSGAWTTGDPKVVYAFDETVDGSGRFDEGFRPDSTTYPSGKKVEYQYTGTANGMLNRTSKLRSDLDLGSVADVAEYKYSGSGSVMEVSLATSTAVKLRYDEGDDGTYEHRDRFGRVIGQGWKGGSVYRDKYDYTYDSAGNRTSRTVDDAVNSSTSLDQTFTYDQAHRLDLFKKAGTTERDWDLDGVGNWVTFAVTGQTTQTRTHNTANETSTISNWPDPTHDGAGNMKTVPQPGNLSSSSYTLKCDAWNRLVEVKDGSTVVAAYEYDGLNRRIVKSGDSISTHHYYYNSAWQVLEVRTGSETGSVYEENAWHPHYVDALALRVYNSERYFALQDANFNVTALLDTSGDVLERYNYTPYGELEVLEANFTADSDGLSDYENPYTYTGRRFDSETGIYYYRNRYYHAQLGRFCTRDPIGYFDGLNRYGYVGGRPLISTDPTGEITLCSSFSATINAAIGPGPIGQSGWGCGVVTDARIRTEVGNALAAQGFPMTITRSTGCPGGQVCCPLGTVVASASVSLSVVVELELPGPNCTVTVPITMTGVAVASFGYCARNCCGAPPPFILPPIILPLGPITLPPIDIL